MPCNRMLYQRTRETFGELLQKSGAWVVASSCPVMGGSFADLPLSSRSESVVRLKQALGEAYLAGTGINVNLRINDD